MFVPIQSGSGGYEVKNSLRLRSAASSYLSRTPASAGNRTSWTMSFWFKRASLGVSYQTLFACNPAGTGEFLRFNSSDALGIGSNGTETYTTAVYRDMAAWYHCTWRYTGTQHELYINNINVLNKAQTYSTNINNTTEHDIGRENFGASGWFDGYIAEFNFIDGQALLPTSFGVYDAISNQWEPKRYTGTYGSNGYYLQFQTNTTVATLGNDSSGNGLNWTPAGGISLTADDYDQMFDSPTNNFATYQPFDRSATTFVLSKGNLNFTNSVTNTGYCTVDFIGSAKYYLEAKLTTWAATNEFRMGVESDTQNNYIVRKDTGSGIYVTGVSQTTVTLATTSTLSLLVDCGARTVAYYIDNVLQYTTPALTGTRLRLYTYGIGAVAGWVNYGQRPFTYTMPAGATTLSTKGIPDVVIADSRKLVQPKVYAGANNTGGVTISGIQHAPDLILSKNKSSAGYYWNTYNSVIGAGNNSELQIQAVAEGGGANDTYDYLSSFTSDGFVTTYSGTNTSAFFNTVGNNYLIYSFKANGSSTTSNTLGSITSQVSANNSSGFSIIKYTGTGVNATVGHGLNTTPTFIIYKNRSAATNWSVYHKALSSTEYMLLNSNGIKATDATMWNSTIPTSTTLSIGTHTNVNTSANNYIAFAWTDVEGLVKTGSYLGTGSTDGPYQYCGFRPALVLIKNLSSTTTEWVFWDTIANPTNAATYVSYPSSAAAEASGVLIDILSTGFKLRNTNAALNFSAANNHIWIAFAENPFKYANAR